jgi:hypothetical protein
MLFFLGMMLCLSASAEGTGRKTVNSAAAVRSLERATQLLAAHAWQDAAFEARLGETYDAAMADFPYIEALSLIAQKAPRADILERVRFALGDGFFWRSYTKNDAIVLCARLQTETCAYREAQATLSLLKDYTGSDADYVRAAAFYGLGKPADARAIVAKSLDRWPFDSRFPRLFLTREASLKPDAQALKIAATVVSRLYVWENDDRELLLLAVPFETDQANRERDIRTYRSMGKRDLDDGSTFVPAPASALAALEYGLLDEPSAAREILATSKTGIRLPDLNKLSELAGSAAVRKEISAALDSFDGIVSDDANGDGIDDVWIQYRLGRPLEAVFDPNQDGHPDYTVACNLGAPVSIVGPSGETVTYDTYPNVRSVVKDRREYTMTPLALKWAPVIWKAEDFRLGGSDFYAIALTGKDAPLTDRYLASSAAFYTERDEANPKKLTRVSLNAGVPVSLETSDNGRVVAQTTYARGAPVSRIEDRDGDGYFETRSLYGPEGKLLSVLVDRNANRTVEYREDYAKDGSVTAKWDSDENGTFEISQTTSADGIVRTSWLHPVTGKPVTVVVERGAPRSVSYGSLSMPVVKDPIEDLWWVRRIPPGSRAFVKKIAEAFNPDGPSVVSVILNIDGKRVCAVRTGGLVFAELLDE